MNCATSLVETNRSDSLNIYIGSGLFLRFMILIAYMSSPCHIEVILTEKEDVVAKATEEEPSKKKLSKKKLARQKEKMMRE